MTEIKEAKKPETAVAKKESATAVKKTPKTIRDYVTIMQPEIQKALPKTITAERFTRIALSALSSNPDLANCTPKSFLASLMNSAQLGLEVNSPLGLAYLIPYKNKGQLECQFQLGYLGMVELAHRAGTSVTAEAVYENDEFEYELGMNPRLIHKPAMKNRGHIIAYYATWKNSDMRAEGFVVMSKEDIENHAKRFSKSYNSAFSPWQTSFDMMAKKTCLKQALKYAPMSSEIRTAMSQDETVKSELNADMTTVENEIDYAEVVETDPETGEVKDDSEK